MITFQDEGIALCQQRITPGNTATALSKYCYNYQRFKIVFTDGDVELTENSWIVGAYSGATAKIVEVHADTAVWTDNTGYIIVDSWNGTAWTASEEIKQAAQATVANVSGLIRTIDTDYPYRGMQAKSALVCVLANTVLVDLTGGTPDPTALIGIPMIANSSYVLRNIKSIMDFKVIDRVASSAGTVDITYFF